MFILGTNFCGGELACACTPTSITDINYIEIQNGIYNNLYVTKNVTDELDGTIPTDWDYDTILYAKFSSNTNAGNVDWNMDTVSDILIKSRPANEFTWKTLIAKKVTSVDDFTIDFNDYLTPSGQTTEYAITPVLYGSEGVYSVATATPEFTKIFVIEADIVYGTSLLDGGITITRNIPSSNVELLNSRHPIFVRNTIANYDTGSVTGLWLPITDEEGCETAQALNQEYDYYRTSYQKEFIDFLADFRPKIIKDDIGHLWVGQITPNIEDAPGNSYADRKLTFQFVEVGDWKSQEDLYYLGLLDVPQEWW